MKVTALIWLLKTYRRMLRDVNLSPHPMSPQACVFDERETRGVAWELELPLSKMSFTTNVNCHVI